MQLYNTMTPKEYINNKTNSILKNSINRNNRDIVATIVYNELTDILDYCKNADDSNGVDVSMVNTMLHKLKSQLYSDIPMKLKPYCIQYSNGYFRGIYDPYVLALLTADAEPWVWEKDGIQFLEIQEDKKYITYSTKKHNTHENCKNKRAEDKLDRRTNKCHR